MCPAWPRSSTHDSDVKTDSRATYLANYIDTGTDASINSGQNSNINNSMVLSDGYDVFSDRSKHQSIIRIQT